MKTRMDMSREMAKITTRMIENGVSIEAVCNESRDSSITRL